MQTGALLRKAMRPVKAEAWMRGGPLEEDGAVVVVADYEFVPR